MLELNPYALHYIPGGEKKSIWYRLRACPSIMRAFPLKWHPEMRRDRMEGFLISVPGVRGGGVKQILTLACHVGFTDLQQWIGSNCVCVCVCVSQGFMFTTSRQKLQIKQPTEVVAQFRALKVSLPVCIIRGKVKHMTHLSPCYYSWVFLPYALRLAFVLFRSFEVLPHPRCPS